MSSPLSITEMRIIKASKRWVTAVCHLLYCQFSVFHPPLYHHITIAGAQGLFIMSMIKGQSERKMALGQHKRDMTEDSAMHLPIRSHSSYSIL